MKLSEEDKRKIGIAKCHLKGFRRALKEKKELEEEEPFTLEQKEMIKRRINAINEVYGEFLSKLYTLDYDERKIIEIYVSTRSYEELIEKLKDKMNIDEDDYKHRIPMISLKLAEITDTQTDVSDLIKAKIQQQ